MEYAQFDWAEDGDGGKVGRSPSLQNWISALFASHFSSSIFLKRLGWGCGSNDNGDGAKIKSRKGRQSGRVFVKAKESW